MKAPSLTCLFFLPSLYFSFFFFFCFPMHFADMVDFLLKAANPFPICKPLYTAEFLTFFKWAFFTKLIIAKSLCSSPHFTLACQQCHSLAHCISTCNTQVLWVKLGKTATSPPGQGSGTKIEGGICHVLINSDSPYVTDTPAARMGLFHSPVSMPRGWW